MSKILYISSGGFPYGDARSMRMRGFCSIFNNLGYTVDVVSDWNTSTDEPADFPWICLTKQTRAEFEANNAIKRLGKYFKSLSDIFEANSYELAFVTEMPERVNFIQRLCRKYGVPTVGESCEWYDPSTWKHGVIDPHNIAFQFAHHFNYPKWNGVVSISSFLDRHYSEIGVPSVVVPTILDVASVSSRIDSDAAERDINILFAGTFGGTKDGVTPIVSAALQLCPKNSRKVVISLLGPSEETAKASLGTELYFRAMKAGVLKILPRVPQEQVSEYWRNADYGTFLRPRRRSSEAGFPTKLGEGMAAGTPFITNRTGDIPLYVKTGKNGFLLDRVAEESCVAVLERLLAMSNEDHTRFRLAARTDAEGFFDYRNYQHRVKQIIQEVVG